MARRTVVLAIAAAVLGTAAPGAEAEPCNRWSPPPTRIVQTAPPEGLLSRLEVLRRPQTEADSAYLSRVGRGAFLRTISGPYVRVLGRTTDDSEVVLIPGTQNFPFMSRRCLRRLSPHRRRIEERRQRDFRRRAKEIRLTMFGYAPNGQGGWGAGSLDARGLVNNRSIATIGQQWGGSVVVGLVPDGVATLELTFAGGEARRADVAGNFWSVVVPISPPRAFPLETVWRAADGSAVKTFRDDEARY